MKKITLLLMLISVFGIAQNKPYKGGEILSNQQYRYGKMEVRMRSAKASGVLSTFFTYKNGSEKPDTFWEEIDIEIFGKQNSGEWQSNLITGQGNGGALQRSEGRHFQSGLGDGYHTYTIEWSPNRVRWLVDGRIIRTTNGGQAGLMRSPHSFRFNIWNPNIPEWVGPFSGNDLPVFQYVNWIKYYAWNGSGFASSPTWVDNFNSFDTNRWTKANFTFAENQADFVPANVVVKNGILVLALTRAGQTGFRGTPPADNGGGSPAPTPPSGPTGTGGAPIGRVIAIQKTGGDFKWITAERDGNNQLIARSRETLGWERYTVERHPKGGIALKAMSNGKYVQVQNRNTNAPAVARGSFKGDWERFEWKGKGAGKVALRSVHANRWLQANHGINNAVVFPRGDRDLQWETFNFIFLDGRKELNASTDFSDEIASAETSVYPNPVESGQPLFLEFSLGESAIVTYDIYNYLGQTVKNETIGELEEGAYKIAINDTQNLSTGIYIIKANLGSATVTRRIQVE